jgi:hypothetical protein
LTVGHRHAPEPTAPPHSHRFLLFGAALSSVIMGALLVAFFVYGPTAIGRNVDWVFGTLLALGLVFAIAKRRRAKPSILFAGRDVVPGDPGHHHTDGLSLPSAPTN